METRMMPPPQASARQTEMGDTFNRVLFAALDALQERSIPYGLIGGVAASGHGRPRSTHDIDIFVRPEDAEATLVALDAKGFETERTDIRWLFKGWKDEMMVDIIFKSQGDIYFDDEMFRRCQLINYHGRKIAAVSPEDMIIIKCAVHSELGPHHWHDALAILSHASLDWSYLLSRARRATRRVLALLIYAQSNDIWIPNNVIQQLFENVFESHALPHSLLQSTTAANSSAPNLSAASSSAGSSSKFPAAPDKPLVNTSSHTGEIFKHFATPMNQQPMTHAEAHLHANPIPVVHHHERTDNCPAYMKSHLHEALTTDKRTAHLDCEITIQMNGQMNDDQGVKSTKSETQLVLVTGDAPSHLHRLAIEQVIRDYAPGFQIENNVRVFEMTAEECAPVMEELV